MCEEGRALFVDSPRLTQHFFLRVADIMYTSGTTGNPKGVRLSYKAYSCNRATFEAFLEAGEGKELVAVVVNPMHHTNSTAITDWAMRKPGATLHLLPASHGPPSSVQQRVLQQPLVRRGEANGDRDWGQGCQGKAPRRR